MRLWLPALLGLVLVTWLSDPGRAAANLPAAQQQNKVVAARSDDAWTPTLYALLIGVTHYENGTYDLAYPARDALGLAEALKRQEGKLYRRVEVKVLTDKDATASGVKRGLAWLRKQTTGRDLALIFAAGRGTADAQGKDWLPSYDMDPGNMSGTAVSGTDVSDALAATSGKKLLFLDINLANAATKGGGHDGEQVDMGVAINDVVEARSGVIVFSAATGKEPSLENGQWGHGAFTKALIEGLGGQADLLHRGMITTATLDIFIEDRVKQLTDGRQHPVMTRPNTVPDFPIASLQLEARH